MIEWANVGCAVRALSGVHYNTARESIREVAEEYNNAPGSSCPYIIFADNVAGNGKHLAAYIIKHKLGKLVASDPTTNHDPGCKVTVWIWTVDRKRTVARAKACPSLKKRMAT